MASSGLQGKVTLITGATGVVGPAVVAAFAEDGATIAAASRSEAELAHLREELGLPAGRWAGYLVDLADPAATQALVDAIVARYGRIDILAAVAGGWRGGATVAATEPATFDWLLRTNLLTAFNACRAVLPVMQANAWGRIITVGARSAVTGQAQSGAYAASKAALIALTQSI